MITLLETLKRTADFLSRKAVESPRLNAELLVGHALGLKRMELYLQFERPLSEVELEKIRPLVRRRAAREPLQYILGEADFFHIRLKTDRRALIPRPETEELLERVTARCLEAPPSRILDLGTGTGAIALALAAFYGDSSVAAVDRSAEALQLAAENAAALGLAGRVRLWQGDWFSPLPAGERFELIVANPPYLSEAELAEAAPEVRDFEPRDALVAGAEGRSELERILREAPGYLEPGGVLALEIGIAQRERLLAAAQAAGFGTAEVLPDLSGRDRFLLARLSD